MRPVHRRILAAVLMPMFAAGALAATPPVTGLGQSWPNGADYSASPRFHAYVFDKQGVRYVQINDGNGTVRGAVAYIAGQVLELPIGVDANRWTIITTPNVPSTGEAIYHDDGMTVRASAQPDGTMRMMVAPGDCQAHPENCTNRGP